MTVDSIMGTYSLCYLFGNGFVEKDFVISDVLSSSQIFSIFPHTQRGDNPASISFIINGLERNGRACVCGKCSCLEQRGVGDRLWARCMWVRQCHLCHVIMSTSSCLKKMVLHHGNRIAEKSQWKKGDKAVTVDNDRGTRTTQFARAIFSHKGLLFCFLFYCKSFCDIFILVGLFFPIVPFLFGSSLASG